VEIAPEHPEAVRQRARVHVKKRLLLDRIALHTAGVSPRDPEPAIAVEAHLADAYRAVRDSAVVAAGVAMHPLVVFTRVEIAFAGALGENI